MDYIDTINTYLENRKIQNPQYSLRAFARDMNINAGDLSSILNRKKRITPKYAIVIGLYLELKDNELIDFIKTTIQ